MKPRKQRPLDESQVWFGVQIGWADVGWERLSQELDRRPQLGLVMLGCLALSVGVLGVTGFAALPPLGRVLLAVPMFLVLFVATGWAVLPWLISTDRVRASLPVAVLVVGVGLACLGGWWMVPGIAVMVTSAALGIVELRLIGRDLELEQLKM